MAGDAMGKQNQHVVPHSGQWAVRKEGADRVTSVHKTQQQATETARKIAGNQGADVVVHRKDGTIRQRSTLSK
jgi:uncharacterized protein YdaT